MSSNVYWLVEKRVLLLKPSGEQTDEIITANFALVKSMMLDAESPSYLIIDSTEQKSTSLSPASAKRLAAGFRQNLHEKSSKRVTWTILVTNNVVIRFIASLVVQWVGSKMRAFDSVNEALLFLMERDLTLPKDLLARLESVKSGQSPNL